MSKARVLLDVLEKKEVKVPEEIKEVTKILDVHGDVEFNPSTGRYEVLVSRFSDADAEELTSILERAGLSWVVVPRNTRFVKIEIGEW